MTSESESEGRNGSEASASARQKEFDVLMSEKQHADKQIGSYLENLLKVHTVIFAAAAVGAGWAFSRSGDGFASEEVRAIAALVLAFLASFATLQTVSNYGIVLGYIRYKNQVLGRRFQKLLNLEQNPLAALNTIAMSRSNRLVVIASVGSGVFVLLGAGGLIVYAVVEWMNQEKLGAGFGAAVLACALMWIFALWSGLALSRIMAEVERGAVAAASDSANQPTAPGG